MGEFQVEQVMVEHAADQGSANGSHQTKQQRLVAVVTSLPMRSSPGTPGKGGKSPHGDEKYRQPHQAHLLSNGQIEVVPIEPNGDKKVVQTFIRADKANEVREAVMLLGYIPTVYIATKSFMPQSHKDKGLCYMIDDDFREYLYFVIA